MEYAWDTLILHIFRVGVYIGNPHQVVIESMEYWMSFLGLYFCKRPQFLRVTALRPLTAKDKPFLLTTGRRSTLSYRKASNTKPELQVLNLLCSLNMQAKGPARATSMYLQNTAEIVVLKADLQAVSSSIPFFVLWISVLLFWIIL